MASGQDIRAALDLVPSQSPLITIANELSRFRDETRPMTLTFALIDSEVPTTTQPRANQAQHALGKPGDVGWNQYCT